MSGGPYPDRDPQLFYELARDRHAAQAALLESLDSKLVFLLSGSSALLSILVAVYALRPDAFDGWEVLLAIVSATAWLLLTLFALNALRASAWLSGPKLGLVYARHSSGENDATQKWHVATHYWNDYKDNRPLQDRKVFALRVALGLFVIQTVLLVAALALVALSESDTQRRFQRPAAAALVPARVLAVDLAREDQADLDSARFRSSVDESLTRYAASGTARARLNACASRASIVRSA